VSALADHTAPASPYRVPFAMSIASSSLSYPMTHSTGPKTSCCATSASAVTSARTVGWT
jgi:hypothetical protein